jgi:chaperone modulatory protein CbpM
MEANNTIAVADFCTFYQIEVDFIEELQRSGLLSVSLIANEPYLTQEQLPQVERFVRLHYDLNINVAGIEAIEHLLGRLTYMQQQVARLHNRLAAYED